MGTNNRESTTLGPFVTRQHGQAWLTLVDNIGNFFTKNGYIHTDVIGANDFETDYSTPAAAESWLDGYLSVTTNTLRYIFNYGSAPCPVSTQTGTAKTCGNGNGWTQEHIWYLSWGDPIPGYPSGRRLPLPQIYSKTSAEQWAQMSLYSYVKHKTSMIFLGFLTEEGACTQDNFAHWDGTCAGTKVAPWTPDDAWSAFLQALNKNSHTTQDGFLYSTDIRYE